VADYSKLSDSTCDTPE
jgi:MFS family permease